MNKTTVKPPWTDAPEWAWYLAQDSNGIWWWYEHKPVNREVGWDIGKLTGRAHPASMVFTNWRETLEARPQT